MSDRQASRSVRPGAGSGVRNWNGPNENSDGKNHECKKLQKQKNVEIFNNVSLKDIFFLLNQNTLDSNLLVNLGGVMMSDAILPLSTKI